MAKRTSPAVLQHRRSELEARIEELIALLDLLDGDCDLEENGDMEPSLGGPSLYGRNGFECDLEGDMSDDELPLGLGNPQLGKYELPEGWSPVDGENCSSMTDIGWTGDGQYRARKLLRDNIKDQRKLAKALAATRVSPGYGKFV